MNKDVNGCNFVIELGKYLIFNEMIMNSDEMVGFIATHPGWLLKRELLARKIKQYDFSHDIGIEPVLLKGILNKKRPITPEIALSLEKALGISADFWIAFQSKYDFDDAFIKKRNIRKAQQLEIWKLIKKHIHVSIFRKRGILTKSVEENIAKIFEIFEVNNLDELIESLSVHKDKELDKKSDYPKIDQTNILAERKLEQWATKKGNI